MKLKKQKKVSILLVGSLGTGKKSLGKSMVSVLDREYVRFIKVEE